MMPFLSCITVAFGAMLAPLSASALLVDASDGLFNDRVQVLWSKDESARTYTVSRCVTSDVNTCENIGKRNSDEPREFDDFNVEPLVIYNYRVTACTLVGCAGKSEPDSGFRAGVEEDDFGNSCNEATAVGENSSTIGNLETGSDSDYFQIQVPVRGELIVSTQGDTDTTGVLKNSNCVDIASSDTGGAGSNFLISRQLDPGTYYVETRGQSSATGRYQFDSLFIPDDDFGNSCAEATRINPNSTYDGSLETAGDLDYFRIELAGQGVLTLNSNGDTNTYGTLKDANCSTLAASDDDGDGSNFLISRELVAGTYYLETRGASAAITGDYQVQSGFVPVDDHGNDCASATTLSPDGSAPGVLEAENDYDYFHVTVTARGALQLTTTGGTDTYGGLLDASCEVVLNVDDDSGVDTNFLIDAEVDPGEYYVVVLGYANTSTGPYELFSTFTAAGETGGSCETARAIGNNARLSDEIELAGDLDYFRLDIVDEGALRLNSTSEIDMFGVLKNANCETIAIDDDSGDNLNFLIEAPVSPGTYFLEASGYNDTTGLYAIQTEFIPTDDFGGSCEDAYSIAPESNTDGVIGSKGDHDFFRIELSAGTVLHMQTTGDTDTFAVLRDANCGFMRRNDDGGQEVNFRIATYLEAGVYYLEVSGYGDFSTGPYQLQLTASDDGLGVDLDLNPGMNDAWFNLETQGQGFFVTVFPEVNIVFVSWFTFDTFHPDSGVSSELGDPGHRWYTAIGYYYGNEAFLNIEVTAGGLFNSGEAVTQEYGGTLYLRFDDCSNAVISYNIEGKGLSGNIPVRRAVEDNVKVCEFLGRPTGPVSVAQGKSVVTTPQQSTHAKKTPKQHVETAPVVIQESPPLQEINYGLNDAWFNPEWPGQGFFVTVLPDLGGIFISWFTFDKSHPDAETPYNLGSPGHRWLTAFGYFEGNRADIDIELTQGGLFDNPEAVTQGTAGTMSIRFDDCLHATITYHLDQTGEQGEIDIVRVFENPANIFECEFPLTFAPATE